jgi:alpha,alpha-trehalase
LWDPGRGAYLDYRWTRGERIVRVSAATLYPLFVSIASQAQADAVADTALRELLKPGGISTTPIETGQQWDAPNGWAPLQWIAVSGLRRYGHDSLAEAIACRFMVNVNGVYQQSGKLVEKYDVVDTRRKGGGGEYPTQDGFGWTNGVVRKLERQYPADAAYLNAAQCPSVAPTRASSTKLSSSQHARELDYEVSSDAAGRPTLQRDLTSAPRSVPRPDNFPADVAAPVTMSHLVP